MKKVNLVTLTGNGNFGNKLQHFAMQRNIEKMGFMVESTRFIYDNVLIHNIKYLIKRYLARFIFKRFNNFAEFDKKIKYSKNIYYNNKYFHYIDYDYYVVGSDQVWNTTFPSFNENYLLKNINSRNKISYAASFGIDYIDDKYVSIFKNELKKFKGISVRESQGKKIIDDLDINKFSEVSIDPTLLLSSEEWNSLIKKPNDKVPEKYILVYFLGSISSKIKGEIDRVASEYNCKVINVLDKNDDFYKSGPSEFLYLEKNAFLVCTDSFHSSVFAFIFNVPFVVFDRQDKEEKMNSRIDTLLSTLNLKNRRFNGNNILDEQLDTNYLESYKLLKKEIDKSNAYLKKYLIDEK